MRFLSKLVVGILCFSRLLLAEETTASDSFLDQFLLINEAGNLAAPAAPGSKLNSVGVLYLALPPDRYGVCTVTHVAPGKAVTAAHCLPEGNGPQDFTVLFFDKQGNRQKAKVTEFLFRGSESLDVALLEIEPKSAALWEIGGVNIREYQTSWFSSAPKSETVKIWSYTPLESHDFKEKYPNKNGMVFQPNLCQTATKPPTIEMKELNAVTRERKTIKEFVFGKQKEGVAGISFLDDCKNMFIQGNSGALISIADDFTTKVGVLSFYTSDMDQIGRALASTASSQPNIEFFYYGTSGIRQKIYQNLGQFVLGLGTQLQEMAKQKPGFWKVSQKP